MFTESISAHIGEGGSLVGICGSRNGSPLGEEGTRDAAAESHQQQQPGPAHWPVLSRGQK